MPTEQRKRNLAWETPLATCESGALEEYIDLGEVKNASEE